MIFKLHGVWGGCRKKEFNNDCGEKVLPMHIVTPGTNLL